MRYLSAALLRDLQRKAVLVSGPRQVGKSTLAKTLLGERALYLNWDIATDRTRLRKSDWPRDVPLVILDELHKYPKWKSYLKGVIDRDHNIPPLLVTGSARLETFRKSGDALTGRTFHHRLHPIDPLEAKIFLPDATDDARLDRLLTAGGFPESFLNPSDAPRLLADRLLYVVREDARDLRAISSLRSLEILIDLLRERVGGQINFEHLANDLSVSAPTVKEWIVLLERLYLVFLLRPFNAGLARSLRKEPKLFFYDCAATTQGAAAALENLVACALLKYCDQQFDTHGIPLQVSYFRDRDGREVDFIVSHRRKVVWCIEVKSSDTTVAPSLRYLQKRVAPIEAIQLVRTLSPSDRREEDGVKVERLSDWLLSRLSQPPPV